MAGDDCGCVGDHERLECEWNEEAETVPNELATEEDGGVVFEFIIDQVLDDLLLLDVFRDVLLNEMNHVCDVVLGDAASS